MGYVVSSCLDIGISQDSKPPLKGVSQVRKTSKCSPFSNQLLFIRWAFIDFSNFNRGVCPPPKTKTMTITKKTTIKVQKYLKINWVMFWKWTQSCSENEPSHVSPFRGFEPTPCLSQIPVTSLPAAVSGENVSRLERTRLWRREVVERNIKFGHAVPKKFDGGFVWVKFPGWLS